MSNCAVRLRDKSTGKSQFIVLDSAVSKKDLIDLIESAFGRRNLIGVLKPDDGVICPISALHLFASQFESLPELVLVFADEPLPESRSLEDGSEDDDEDDVDEVDEDDDYSEGSEDAAPVADAILTLAESISESKYLLGDTAIDIEAFLEVNADMIQRCGGQLNREQFLETFWSFHAPLQLTGYQKTFEHTVRRSEFVELIFDSLKYEPISGDEEMISVTDVVSMLSVLCSKDLPRNLLQVFLSYDHSQCAYVSELSLLNHLTVVFTFLFQLSVRVRYFVSQLPVLQNDPRRLAQAMFAQLVKRFPPRRFEGEEDGIYLEEEFVAACEFLIRSGYLGLIQRVDTDADADPDEDRRDRREDRVGDSGDEDRGIDDEESEEEEEEEEEEEFANGGAGADVFVNDFGDDGEYLGDEVQEFSRTLTQRRQILGLTNYSATYVLSFFSDIASEDGLISLSQYHRGMGKLIDRHYNRISARERASADLIISSLFQLFDESDCGYCDLQNLGAGLCIYCGGDSNDKSKALYRLVERYSDPTASTASAAASSAAGNVSLNRMSNCLATIFKTAMLLDDADDCTLLEATYDTLAAEIAIAALADRGRSLREIDCADVMVSKKEFEHCLKSTIVQYFGDSIDDEANGDGSSTCGSSPDKSSTACDSGAAVGGEDNEEDEDSYEYEDARAALEDDEEDSEEEEEDYIPSDTRTGGGGGGKLHLFVDPDSKPPSSGKRRVRGMSYDSDEGGGGIENSPVVLELRSVQDILGLTYFPADDIIDTMGDYSFNGQITEDGFLEVMELVARLGGVTEEGLSVGADIVEKIFAVFETGVEGVGEGDGVASYASLATGLTTLCASSVADKLLVSFTLMDEDGDGLLSSQQFTDLILSHLRVVFVCSETAAEKIRKCGFTLDQIAAALAAEAVKTLSRTQFVEESSQFTLEMVTQMAHDCVELADTVAHKATPVSRSVGSKSR